MNDSFRAFNKNGKTIERSCFDFDERVAVIDFPDRFPRNSDIRPAIHWNAAQRGSKVSMEKPDTEKKEKIDLF